MKLPTSGAAHDKREIEAIVKLLETSDLNIGPAVEAMEQRTAELLSKRHGVMVNSGSSAIRLAIDLLNLERGDEIITSPLTFSTDVAPMVQSGIVPVFADVDKSTYQIDANRIAEMVGPRTKAIMVPNLCGNVPDWDAIRSVADDFELTVIEDSCDVLDSWLGDSRTGTRSDISVTSFARTHAITAGGNGGMVGLDSDEQLDQCLSQRRWGRRSESYLFGTNKGNMERFGQLADGTPYDMIFVFDSIGYNFEPSEIGAAYGLVQLDKLDTFNAQRRQNWQHLNDYFAARGDEAGVNSVTTEGAHTTWMRFCFTVPDDAAMSRNDVQAFLDDRGVSTRMVWSGNILRQPGFANIEHRQPDTGLPNCDYLMDRALSLPIHHKLFEEHVAFMCEQVDDLLVALRT